MYLQNVQYKAFKNTAGIQGTVRLDSTLLGTL